MADQAIRVLAIEDDLDYVEILRLCLAEPEAMGLTFALDHAERLAEGLMKLAASRYDAVLVDLGLPDASGLEAAASVLRAAPDAPVLVSTNLGDESTALEAMRLGAQDYMIKASTDSRMLKRAIRYAIERKSLQAQREQIIQLKSEIAERRRADKLKDEWIETVSHDLRTPLTIMKGAVVELHEGRAEPLQPQQALLVGLARRQVERIERMVVDLLDLSRLESGRASVERKALDVGAIVRRVADDFARAADERAVRIEVECEPGTPALFADPNLFEQLVVNLVENALRFARRSIVARVRGAASGAVELTVQDDGVGIPAEKKNLLFTRFGQLERGRAPGGYKGTGLGLAICKEIVGLHRGRIEVVSEPGKGATFRISMPAAGAAPSPFTAAQGAKGGGAG